METRIVILGFVLFINAYLFRSFVKLRKTRKGIEGEEKIARDWLCGSRATQYPQLGFSVFLPLRRSHYLASRLYEN
jgi:hypothetical protein